MLLVCLSGAQDNTKCNKCQQDVAGNTRTHAGGINQSDESHKLIISRLMGSGCEDCRLSPHSEAVGLCVLPRCS